jgi:hypothetical protein
MGRRADRFVDFPNDPRVAVDERRGDERTSLMSFLRGQRLTLELKCSGLAGADLARRAVPPSSMSLLGIVRHLTDVERSWFRRTMAGQAAPPIYRGALDDGDFDGASGDVATVDQAWRLWRLECDFSDSFIRTAPDLSVLCARSEKAVSLRWVVMHMIEEYARHNGHADLLRERIDGRVGE